MRVSNIHGDWTLRRKTPWYFGPPDSPQTDSSAGFLSAWKVTICQAGYSRNENHHLTHLTHAVFRLCLQLVEQLNHHSDSLLELTTVLSRWVSIIVFAPFQTVYRAWLPSAAHFNNESEENEADLGNSIPMPRLSNRENALMMLFWLETFWTVSGIDHSQQCYLCKLHHHAIRRLE